MISQSDAYKAAIVGDVRRIFLNAIVDMVDPDIVYGSITSSGEESISKSSEIHNKEYGSGANYAVLELNQWRLDGSESLYSTDITQEIGFVGSVLSDSNGAFSPSQYLEMQFSGVDTLQAATVAFSENYGYATDFVVEVKNGNTVLYSKTFANNTENRVAISGFTANNPTAIRVTVSKWSLPYTRLRISEIIPGYYEKWDSDMFSAFHVTQQANFANTALPYGTCSITFDNSEKLFEPRNKEGLFRSIEERQGISLAVGVKLTGGAEFKPVGTYYQSGGGWKTGDNGLVMTWNLVDIIGLLSSRKYNPPASLPSTLSGWVESIVAQLGPNFASRYTVDSSVASTSLQCAASDITNITCGDLLTYICMATNTFPRADAETGFLTVEPVWNQGNEVTLDNVTAYPAVEANPDIAYISFTLNDGNNTVLTLSGNDTSADITLQISNPFLTTESDARSAAQYILSFYGGNVYTTVGRGDPSSEVGDVATIQIDESTAVTGRLQSMDLQIQGGVLAGCSSKYIQPTGPALYENSVIITEDTTWTVPGGVTSVRVILVGGGSGGANGENGTYGNAGANGADGSGGKVYSSTIAVSSGQTFSVVVGSGGAIGAAGEDTTFGSYSSANGTVFSPSFTDIQSGTAYGRAGVVQPVSGTGDGGKGGKGGTAGQSMDGSGSPDIPPGNGSPGTAGASGCAMIYWAR